LGRKMRRLMRGGHILAASIAVERLIGATPRLTWGVPVRAAVRADDQVGLSLSPTRREGGPLFVTGARALALALADAVLGGAWPSDGLVAPHTLDPLSQGALTYLAARCLAALAGDYQVVGCLETCELHAALADRPHVRWPAELVVDGRAARVALWVPEADLGQASANATTGATTGDRQLSPALLRIPVALSVRAGSTAIPAADLETLARGDIVLLDRCSLVSVPDNPRGTCTVHVGDRNVARFDATCEERTITLMGKLPEEPVMTDGKRRSDRPGGGPAKITGTVPVQLTLEVARFTLALEDLADLQVGDVLATHANIGAAVTLRAGELPIARGELVDCEGEIGVRITDVLLSQAPAAAPETGEAPVDRQRVRTAGQEPGNDDERG